MNSSRASKPIRLVAVFRHDQDRKTTPCAFIELADALYYISCNWAFRLSKWSIVLRKPLPLKLRDASSNIRESTILAAASGSKYHRALIQEAWG